MAACRVLVVDDDRLVLDLLAETLNRCGYDVCPASGPRQALDIIRNQPPFDLVLSDVVMPEMPGTDLVFEVRRLRPETACVLMTGGLFDATRLPPGVPVLHKPFLRIDLVRAVEGAIARSAELRTRLD